MTKCGRFPHNSFISPIMSGLSKILPRNNTARACEAVSSFCISASSERMVFGIGQGSEYGRGFDPCGFVRLLGLEADGGEKCCREACNDGPCEGAFFPSDGGNQISMVTTLSRGWRHARYDRCGSAGRAAARGTHEERPGSTGQGDG